MLVKIGEIGKGKLHLGLGASNVYYEGRVSILRLRETHLWE